MVPVLLLFGLLQAACGYHIPEPQAEEAAARAVQARELAGQMDEGWREALSWDGRTPLPLRVGLVRRLSIETP